ncbi:hypothetical protein BU24DRAFT_429352 [Aaosphaeria arxii CBS 175.79]|uniref:Uncharacterized protein n=1 Tax=Aaosphaeria arxii CBS 175.79 TaxID=1450172 RepID=A0A6A5X6H6_9PLEO|nr:uncharacterized protein BU24DRAFT_429352 [Aaosphaeria arxii CBS 175.79]KAF2008522.1 hypothetical protein BU24DRAFT_429352 [Aaosphaeria arxii CBS 175.79]
MARISCARLNHRYLAHQAVAIVTPPVVFFLVSYPNSPPWDDFALNVLLSILGWLPGIIHASMFLHKAYQVNSKHNGKGSPIRLSSMHLSSHAASGEFTENEDTNDLIDKTDQASIREAQFSPSAVVISPSPDPSPALIQSPEAIYVQEPTPGRVSDDSSLRRRTSILSPLPPSFQLAVPRHRYGHHATAQSSASSVTSDHSIAGSIKSSVHSVLSVFSISTISRDPAIHDHKSQCQQCTRCHSCFQLYAKRAKHSSLENTEPGGPCDIEVRRKHHEARHHPLHCICEACTGDGHIPRDYGEHARGCRCSLCRHEGPGHTKRPHEPNPWIYGPQNQVITGSIVGGMGHGMGW